MYKYNNVECINYIPSINNNVEQVKIDSDDINDNKDGYNKNTFTKNTFTKGTFTKGGGGNKSNGNKSDTKGTLVDGIGNKGSVGILIKNLKKQIIKIETLSKNGRDKEDIVDTLGKGKGGNGSSSCINIFKISNPLINNIKTNKKYIGLIFISDTFIKSSFITLSKNIYIINYYITLQIDNKNTFNNNNNNYFFSLGIKNNDLSKVSIIKGSKQHINIKNNIINNQIIIKDMLLYEACDNQELCLIVEFNKRSKIIEDKSMIKIVSL